MTKVLVEESSLQNIASAIRDKLDTETQYKPGEMAEAIQEIDTSGITPIGIKQITENGIVDVTQFANAEVNVQPKLQEKTTTENGEITPDSEYDGLSRVTVNVPESGGDSGASGVSSDHYRLLSTLP